MNREPGILPQVSGIAPSRQDAGAPFAVRGLKAQALSTENSRRDARLDSMPEFISSSDDEAG